MIPGRICTKCGVEKPATEFTMTKKGLYSQCKQCKREYAANRWKNDPLFIARKKEYDASDARRQWARDHARQKRKDPNYREAHRLYMVEYWKTHDGAAKARERRAIEAIRVGINDKRREYYRKVKDTPSEMLISAHRARINKVLKGMYTKADRPMTLLGCSTHEFVNHIESLFLPGMSWENRAEWHIDHIVPCAFFNLSNQDEQRICFNFRNTRPLWAIDNLSKQDKLPLNYTQIIAEIKKALHMEG